MKKNYIPQFLIFFKKDLRLPVYNNISDYPQSIELLWNGLPYLHSKPIE